MHTKCKSWAPEDLFFVLSVTIVGLTGESVERGTATQAWVQHRIQTIDRQDRCGGESQTMVGLEEYPEILRNRGCGSVGDSHYHTSV